MPFGSPSCDYEENNLDLNRYLVSHPIATYFVKMDGDNLKSGGIFNGDILVVDRSLSAIDRHLIIAELNGELLARRYRIKDKRVYLLCEDGRTPPYQINNNDQFSIWGTVTSVIRKV